MQRILIKNIIELGHVFENRFLSKNVETPYYILNLVKYIHQNPVKAKINTIDQYQWSSYMEYIEKYNEEDRIVDTEQILSMFSSNELQAKKEFIKFNDNMLKFQNSEELLEYEIRRKLTDEEVIYFIKTNLKIENIQEIQKYNAKNRDEIIRKIKEIGGVTYKQISRVLGLNIRIIQRACLPQKIK